ncbi:MAG TPA: nucleoside triphosphate pyrophosphohydrolase [Bacillota bacterium]|jgi:tetrapyrrole methylase family protein/MazG family protein|nr:nucleoside triphosphate pyrophosphohydrolase [Bacillota bacterium]
MAISVLGLVDSLENLNLAVWKVLTSAHCVYLGRDHAALRAKLEEEELAYELWAELAPKERAERLLAHHGAGENAVYVAEKLPPETDEAVRLLKGKGKIYCPGLLEYLEEKMGVDLRRGTVFVEGQTLAGFNPSLPNLLWGPFDRESVAKLKERAVTFPAGYRVKACFHLGTSCEEIEERELTAVDAEPGLSCLYLPQVGNTGAGEKIEELERVMARLRSENGCPWDREQTLQTLQQYLIEEAYEVLDALAQGDPDAHCEELGDVLLQIVFQSRIAFEQGQFSLQDVIASETEKMIRRHPHVFGQLAVSSVEGVLENWEKIKAKERGGVKRKSLLDGIPKGLPALARAYKIQDKAAKVGFQWDDVKGALVKVDEELDELKTALEEGEQAAVEEEFGDLLFALVNVARYLSVYPEIALNKTVGKFERRFRYIEEHAEKPLEEMTLEEMDKLWDQAKLSE